MMVAKIILVLLGFSIISCSSEYHLKQAIKKNPSLLDSNIVVKFDTLIVTKSVSIHDSFVTKKIDTLFIENEKGWTKIIRNYDKIYVDQFIKGDSFTIVKEIKVPQIIYKEAEKSNFWLYIVILVVSLFAIYKLTK